MGTVLKFLDPFGDEEGEFDYNDDSMWIKDEDIYRGSTNVKTKKKIQPGIYAAEINQQNGLFCRKLDSASDELFKFEDSLIDDLSKEINSFWEKRDLYKEHKLIHKRGILLYGYPGTGKSSTISLLSEDLIKKGGVIFKVNSPGDLITHINFIKYSFRKIEPETPIITILEDINKYEEMEVELLDFLDGKNQINHHVVIATSNNTTNIPNTLLRPSRLDLKIKISLPTSQIRKEFFIFKGVPDEDLNELVESTSKFSIADLKEVFICKYLLGYSIKDSIDKLKTKVDKKSFMDNNLTSKKLGF